jgi:hypothetical protein
MSLKRPSPAAPANPAHSVPRPKSKARSGVRDDVRDDVRNDLHKNDLRNAVRSGAEGQHPTAGFGMPCSNCRLYYPANLKVCPGCNSAERVSSTVRAIPKVQAAAEPSPEPTAVTPETDAFVKQFKAQLFSPHAETTNVPTVCTQSERHVQGTKPASICKPCFDRLQERVDVCEAALHMDLKEAAQIIYAAVSDDPSDPSETCTNAAGALLSELRKRAGVSSLRGSFHPLGN